MKLSRFTLAVLGILLGLPASVYSVVQLYKFIAPNAPNVSALVRQDKMGLPAAYRKFLTRADRKEILAFVDAAEVLRKSGSFSYSPYTAQDLRDFASLPNVFPHDDPQVTTVKISNKGNRTASKIKLYFPEKGFAEINRDGAGLRTEETAGWIDLGPLEASSVCTVKFWSSSYVSDRDIRVVSDDAVAPVKPWLQLLDEQPWQLRLGIGEILLFVWLACCAITIGGSIRFFRGARR